MSEEFDKLNEKIVENRIRIEEDSERLEHFEEKVIENKVQIAENAEKIKVLEEKERNNPLKIIWQHIKFILKWVARLRP